MNKIKNHLLFTGASFVLFAYRHIFSKTIETGAEILLFFLLIYLIVQLLKNNEHWLAYFVYTLLIFYNPYFLIYYDIQEYGLADYTVAILFGLITALWSLRTHNPLSDSRSKYFEKRSS